MAYFTWVYEESKLLNIANEQQGAKDKDKPIHMHPMNPRAMNSSAETEEGACEYDLPIDRAGDHQASSAAKHGSQTPSWRWVLVLGDPLLCARRNS